MAQISPDKIIISSPHPDWGFKVPLFFLKPSKSIPIDTFLTQEDPPQDHYRIGRDLYFAELKNNQEKIALIASGDLSHRLKIDGPYGLHPDGKKFDLALITALENHDLDTILNLDQIYPEARMWFTFYLFYFRNIRCRANKMESQCAFLRRTFWSRLFSC